ncbi:MAG TPA: site-specific DNA-methyltransferase [Methanobacteriaceae archaeon]|nr:site-specific DNA-methyltransferase [Methanobacteriaceae archaeon]
MTWKLYEADCFDVFPSIEDGSIDMVLCDLPYGTTACKWDTPLPLDELWGEYKRVVKDNGAIVLTASQPFTTRLISSNYEMFRYTWVWEKDQAPNFLMAKHQPLKKHEDVCVFSLTQSVYNPQMEGDEFRVINRKPTRVSENYGGVLSLDSTSSYEGRYPTSIISFNKERGFHPTQKPVALFEYLIKTYTNEGDLILDNCAGSGTTGVACQNLNRSCILIEKEPEYCQVIRDRMETVESLHVEARKQQTLTDYIPAK